MKWVIDASVAAKWLAPEEHSNRADALMEEQLLAPDLLFAEVANILWKKQMRSEMDAAAAMAAQTWLSYAAIETRDCSGLMQDALDLALRLRHPAYDCFYLALALRENCSLITADRKLLAICQNGPIPALSGKVVHLADFPTGN